MSYPVADRPLWVPDCDRVAAANMTAFARSAEGRWGRALPDYPALHAWSVNEPAEFWASIWELGEVRGELGGLDGGQVGLRAGERLDGHRYS